MTLWSAKTELFTIVPHEQHSMTWVYRPRAEITLLNSHFSTMNILYLNQIVITNPDKDNRKYIIFRNP